MPVEDVRAAREHPGLRRGHRTVGCIFDPVELVATTKQERRHCRSCGFPAGDDELILRFHYGWPLEGEWGRDEEPVVIHVSGCQHGAAHEMVVRGLRHSIAGTDLDEVEQEILALRVSGLSDRRIAETVGTTTSSIATLLRRVTRRLKLAGDQHARQTLDALRTKPQASESVDQRLGAMLDELTG